MAAMPLDEPLIGDTKFDTLGPDVTVEALPARSVIGGYHVLEEIGRGGMGVVYRAFDAELKRHVALKVLTGGSKASVDALVRFRGEAELVAKLQHPHIVQIYDSGEHEGQQFLVLELVDGGSLEKFIAGKPQDAREAAATIETLARAVEVAHQEGIIHRDLKPANVLRSRLGSLKITDFGLAKQLDHSLGFSRTGDLRGTPQYMAPEQAARDGGSVSAATDVYALGAMLFEMLTGRPPFVANNLLDILDQIISAEPASPSQLVPRLPRDLCTICLKCLEKDPKRRYPTAAALADDLRRWLDGLAITARPLSKSERGVRWLRRHPMGASLAVASGVAIAALTLYGFSVQERRHHEQQVQEAEKHRIQSEALFTRAVDAVDGFYKDVIASDPQLSRKKELLRSLIQRYMALVALQKETRSQNRDQLAGSFTRLGKLLDTIGDKYAALEAYYKAYDLCHDDAEQARTPAARHAVAQLYLAIGNVHGDTGDRAQADEYLQLATRELQSLVDWDATNPAYRQDLAEAWHSQGALFMFWKGSAAAYDPLVKGRTLNEQLQQEKPNDHAVLRGLARSHGYLGDIELDLGRTADAEASYNKSHELRRRLAEEPGAELESRFQYARSFRNFGNLHAKARDYAKAEAAYREALAIQDEIVKLDKSVADYQFDRTNSLCRIAELKIMTGANAEAAELANLAVAAARPLEEAGLKSTAMGGGLADALLHAVVAVIDDKSQDVSWQLNEINDASMDTPDPNSAYVLAAARALIGERTDIAEEIRQCWRDGAMEKLREAIESGYRRKHPDDLKRDRAFRSLADDEEFKKLMVEYASGPKSREN
jgi:eukaryotic-like serine/threonine-protein kinase